MSRHRNVYKQAYNTALGMLGEGAALPSEPELSARLGVSRTTVRSILSRMSEGGLIGWHRQEKAILRLPEAGDYYPAEETDSLPAIVERAFLQRLVRGDLEAGTSIRESELARELGVATTTVREFLIRFSRFGLIEKRQNSRWVLRGFNQAFALELADIREMFELRSALAFVALDRSSPLWGELEAVEAEHLDLRERIGRSYAEFNLLDQRFHRLVHRAARNRFIDDFYDVISMVFHHHYQWSKADERERNTAALEEHLDYIAALRSGLAEPVERTCRRHLASARKTLMQAMPEEA